MSEEIEKRGITSGCSSCGRRMPASELRGGKCPDCRRLEPERK